jgi:hypothetical protein
MRRAFEVTYPNPFGDGTTGKGLPERSYIGDPPTTPPQPSWVIPIGQVVPLAGLPPTAPEPPDYSSALVGLTKTLDRIGAELAALREQVAKLSASKRRRKK